MYFETWPRGARELLIGNPLSVELDRSMPADVVRARLADLLPDLAAGLAEQSSVRDLLHRWRLLSALGRTDLVLARLLEGHLDAVAILAEAGRAPTAGAVYGVWASASGGTGLSVSPDVTPRGASGSVPDTSRKLSGRMRFCSGATLVDRALTTARNDAGELVLLDIGVSHPQIRQVPGSWPAVGMDASESLDVEVDDFPLDAGCFVGPPEFYLGRPGLHLGGIGVSAVWLGALQGLLDATMRVLADHQPDEHGLAHLGAVSTAIESAAATLAGTAQRLAAERTDPLTGLCDVPAQDLARTALLCRSAVEAAVGIGTSRLPRVVGPVALGRDGDFAHRLADLEVFVRQHHGERDLARLGAAEFEAPWSDGRVGE